LQFNKDFRFSDATRLLFDYLAEDALLALDHQPCKICRTLAEL
jgi:hypothetical protein